MPELSFTKENCVDLLCDAMKKFYCNDDCLIKNDVHEIAMAFRIGIYLQENINENNLNLTSKCKVDLEYNRHNSDQKCNDDDPSKTIRPDIIIHERGNDLNNKLYIEIKKDIQDQQNQHQRTVGWNHDMEKLKMVTRNNGTYHYKYGVFLVISIKKPHYCVFEDGSVIGDGQLKQLFL